MIFNDFSLLVSTSVAAAMPPAVAVAVVTGLSISMTACN